MRKFNAILTAAILLLFILHGVLGAFQMLGLGSVTMRVMAWTLAALILAHTVLGVKLTWDSLRVWRRTGAPYFRENRLFWARRISGLAVMLMLLFHVMAFSYTTAEGVFRLRWFDGFKLATQLLLVASIAVHVITNVKPMLIAFGIRSLRPRAQDILFVLSVLLCLMAAAFIVYYIRWNGR